ncbi:hypothetical protein CEXT_748471 [Caerostris extrusa]|uniref:Uncharacterized protein n=1 Tax=Caerostris extrusa TaxID=172846 RepID=A0AAV4NA47_CAEEX|nr:hypothetical protein CEXT_748471 [Caerostris extrusa]
MRFFAGDTKLALQKVHLRAPLSDLLMGGWGTNIGISIEENAATMKNPASPFLLENCSTNGGQQLYSRYHPFVEQRITQQQQTILATIFQKTNTKIFTQYIYHPVPFGPEDFKPPPFFAFLWSYERLVRTFFFFLVLEYRWDKTQQQ